MIPSCFSLDHWVDNISLPPPRRNTLKREPDVKKKKPVLCFGNFKCEMSFGSPGINIK